MSILRVLRNRLIYAPVKLSTAIRGFDGLKHIIPLYELAREYLPGDYAELLGMDPQDAGRAFIRKFGKEYFPLPDVFGTSNYGESPLEKLTRHIPVTLHGLQRYHYDAYWNVKYAHILAGALIASPFADADNLALVDSFVKNCEKLSAPNGPKDIESKIRKRLRPGGYSLDEIEEALEGVDAWPYPAFLDWCRWLYNSTGNSWLDAEGNPAWERENVEALARDYKAYRQIDDRMQKFNKWIGEDFYDRSMGILSFLEEKIPDRIRVSIGVTDGN